jgi:hypothetical protein
MTGAGGASGSVGRGGTGGASGSVGTGGTGGAGNRDGGADARVCGGNVCPAPNYSCTACNTCCPPGALCICPVDAGVAASGP